MENYLAMRITKRKLDYADVITKYPDCKKAIDELLIKSGNAALIREFRVEPEEPLNETEGIGT